MKKDFSDKFNPILIKELTQGMRAKSFVLVFLLTQLVMLFVTFLTFGPTTNSEIGIFWLYIAVPLLLVKPMLAMGSINAEVKGNTIEMLYLSRLSASKIVTGKYFSQMVKTLLLSVSIFPYIIIRYFAGGIDLIQDIMGFVFLLVANAFLTALSVALSSFSNKYPKTQIVRFILMSFLVLTVMVFILDRWDGFFTNKGVNVMLIDFFVILAMMPFVVYQILSVGISQVGPEAENNLALKRLNCFLVLGLHLVLASFCESPITLFPVIFCFFIAAAEGFFIGDTTHKSTYRPVFKRRILGLLLAPNRYGSVLWANFCLLMIFTVIGLENYADKTVGASELVFFAVPLALCILFFITIHLAKISFIMTPMAFLIAFFIPALLFFCVHFVVTEVADFDKLARYYFNL